MQAEIVTDDELFSEYHQQLRAHFRGTRVDVETRLLMAQLYRTSRDVIYRFETEALRELELTHVGFVILMRLWVTGPRELGDLAQIHRTSKSAILSAVKTLERNGLVRRVRSTEDRRRMTVELTKAGEERIEDAQARVHEVEQDAARSLHRRDRQNLYRLLALLDQGAALADRVE